MAKLFVLNGREKGRTVEFEAEITIGRSSANSFQLLDANVSRHHAKIELRSGRHVLVNLGSRNGLFLNGKEVQEETLRAGDEIGIGPGVQLIFRPELAENVTQEVAIGAPEVVVSDDLAVGTDSMITADLTVASPEPRPTETDPAALANAHRRLAAVHEVALAVHSILDLTQLRNRVVEVVREKLSAQRCVILQPDEQGELRPVAATSVAAKPRGRGRQEIQISKRILELAHAQSKAILSNDVKRDERLEGSKSIEMSGIASVLATPLLRPDRKLGVLYVDTLDSTRLFENEDLRLLTTLGAVVANAIENAQVFTAQRTENRNLKAALRSNLDLIGESPAIQRVFEQIAKVGPTDTTILLRGETGTGKELVAKAIHDASPRRDKPFVAVNCAALSESLLSSELFGHEKGAFTGAHEQRPGKFEVADGGTLFLDEIGEVSPLMQAKLLRVLQERVFERVGGVKPLKVDVRIMAATNRDLEEAIRESAFRQDLYFRLSVVPIHLPPLRERKEDLPLLVSHFLDRYSRRTGKHVRGVVPDCMAVLNGYLWPGNVRELQNVIERAVVLCEGDVLGPHDLPPDLRENRFVGDLTSKIGEFDLALPDIVRWVEKTAIERALQRTTKKVELARILRISRPTLDKKLKDYQISIEG